MNKRTSQFMRTATMILTMITLVGCGQQSTSKNSATHSKVSSSQQSSSSKSSSKASSTSKSSSASSQVAAKAQTNTPWNTTKDQQLQAFIDNWGPKMHQNYTKYDGHTPLKTSVGISYPEALYQSKVTNDSGIVGWSTNGDSYYDYNVVAIYNYDGTQPPLPNRITYVFAFHHGQPISLVDESRDGNPSLSETQNSQVKAAFKKIAGDTTNHDQANTIDANTIGILLELKLGAQLADLKKNQYLDAHSYSDKYPYCINLGTGASLIPYRFTSTMITYGVYDPDYPEYEGVFIDHTVSLQSLVDAYYHTPAQIAAVKQVVAKLKP